MKQWKCPSKVPPEQMVGWEDSYHSVWSFQRGVDGRLYAYLTVRDHHGFTYLGDTLSIGEYMLRRGHDWRPAYPAKVHGNPRLQRSEEREALARGAVGFGESEL